MGWILFVIIVFAQLLIALCVVVFLARRLDRELIDIALETLFALPVTGAQVQVRIKTCPSLKLKLKNEMIYLIKRKIPQASIDFLEEPGLRGGVVIELPDQIIDFSLASRLKRLWS